MEVNDTSSKSTHRRRRSLLYRWRLQPSDSDSSPARRYKRLADFASEYRLSKYKAHLCTLDPNRCKALTGGTLVAIHEDEGGRAVPVMPRPSHYKDTNH